MAPRKDTHKQPKAEAMADAEVMNAAVASNARGAPNVTAPRGRAVAIGRDGKPIWRTQTSTGDDPYALAKQYEPEGWAYEWKRETVRNQVDSQYHSGLHMNGGWTRVPHERHPGVFGSLEAKGGIICGDLGLWERPEVLHKEAMSDLKRAADEKMYRAKSERGLAAASAGIDVNTPQARANTFVRQAVDPTLQEDIAAARPAYDRSNMAID